MLENGYLITGKASEISTSGYLVTGKAFEISTSGHLVTGKAFFVSQNGFPAKNLPSSAFFRRIVGLETGVTAQGWIANRGNFGRKLQHPDQNPEDREKSGITATRCLLIH